MLGANPNQYILNADIVQLDRISDFHSEGMGSNPVIRPTLYRIV